MPATADIKRSALELDKNDKLAPLRDLFVNPTGTVFLDANSVGPMPVAVQQQLANMQDDWSKLRRRGWNQREWLERSWQIGDALAPLIGAETGQCVVSDNTSINLYKALRHALAVNSDRHVILTQHGNFPTDLYIAEGVARDQQKELRYLDRMVDFETTLDEQVAVVYLSLVDYRDSSRWDLQQITAQAHAAGALIIWDLSHAAGAVPVDVRTADVDYAVVCGYKYLCGGPGAPSLFYVKPDLIRQADPAIQGWMGHANVYAFAEYYQSHPDIRRFLTGTPAVIADEIFYAAAEIWKQIDVSELNLKHAQLGDYFSRLLEVECGEFGLKVTSQREADKRGGHISISTPNGGYVAEALNDHGVVCSFRQPDAIRFGLCALTLRFADIDTAVARLKQILRDEIWREPKYQKISV